MPTGLDPRLTNPSWIGGIALVLLAAFLMLATDATVAAPITLLIVGIVLIATSRPHTAR